MDLPQKANENEVQSVLRENENSYEREIEQFEGNINQLNEILDDLQTVNTQNCDILKINNSTKTELNKSFKRTKDILSQIYNFLQQMKWDLFAYEQEVESNGNLDYKEECIKRLEKKCVNQLKLFDILEQNILNGDSSAIECEINELDQKEYYELGKKLIDELEEKRRILQTIKTKLDILQDKIMTENQNREKLIKHESEINTVPPEEILRARKEDDETEEPTEQLDKECEEVETNLRQAEIDDEEQTEELNAEFDLKIKIIEGKETEVFSCQDNIKKMGDEIAAIKDEFISLSLIVESNEEIDFANKKMEENIEQNQNRVNELNAKATILNVEYQDIEEELKSMTLEIDDIKKEIQGLKAFEGKKVTSFS